MVRIDREVKSALSDKQQDQVIQKAIAAIADADGVIFEDYNKGLLTAKVIRKAITYAKSKKKIDYYEWKKRKEKKKKKKKGGV